MICHECCVFNAAILHSNERLPSAIDMSFNFIYLFHIIIIISSVKLKFYLNVSLYTPMNGAAVPDLMVYK